MSSRYSKRLYKDLGGDEEPVDFDFFDDDTSEKVKYQSNKHPLSTSTPAKQASASYYSPRSTDLESARSAASSRSSLSVRVPTVSPSRDGVASDTSDDEDNYRSKSDNLKQAHAVPSSMPDSKCNKNNSSPIPKKHERPKTCKPRSRFRRPDTTTGDQSSSDSGSYSSSFTSYSSYSSDNTDSDSDTDSGSVTDVSPLHSPNSPDNLKDFSGRPSDERVEEKMSSKNTKFNSKEMHYNKEGSKKRSKKESVRFVGVNTPNGHKSPPVPRWNESEAQELSMLLRAVLEMDEAPKVPGKQRSRPTSAKSTLSHASTKSLPHKRMNLSFSNDRVRQIDRENQRLLQQIMKKSGVEPRNTRVKTKPKRALLSQSDSSASGNHQLSHSALRRQREQRRIEIENMQILRRIDSAKPTREITKEALLEDHYKLTRYGQQVSKSPIRPTSAKSTPGKQSMSEASSLLSLYSNDSSSKAGSRSLSRPTSAKKFGFKPPPKQPKRAWDDHWQGTTNF